MNKEFTTVIYCRKSRANSIEELENQIELCKKYCKEKGYIIHHIYSEIISSNAPIRPEMDALQAFIKEHTRVRVVCTNIDRLFRNTVSQLLFNELVEKQESIIETVSTGVIQNNTPESKVMNSMLSSFSQYYYDLTRKKLEQGKQNFREKGGYMSSVPPFAYDIKDKRLVINPKQADTVQLIFKLCIDGYSCNEIAEHLNAKGLYNAKGNEWNLKSIRLIIKKEDYTGKTITYPQIISKETFLKAQQCLKTSKQSTKRSYPLSQKIVCSKCGTVLNIGNRKSKGYQNLYSCNSSNKGRQGEYAKCDCVGCIMDIVNDMVLHEVKAMAEKLLEPLYNQLKEDELLIRSHRKELTDRQEEINKLRSQLKKLNQLFLMDNISEAELAESSREVKDKIELMELELKESESYTLSKIIDELQSRIVKLENLKEATSIDSVAHAIKKVYYYKNTLRGFPKITVELKEI